MRPNRGRSKRAADDCLLNGDGGGGGTRTSTGVCFLCARTNGSERERVLTRRERSNLAASEKERLSLRRPLLWCTLFLCASQSHVSTDPTFPTVCVCMVCVYFELFPGAQKRRRAMERRQALVFNSLGQR